MSVTSVTALQVFWSELAGTAVLLALGVGTSANTTLARTAGRAGGYLMGALGWALGVYAGVFVAHRSGAHLNPAVTLGALVGGDSAFAPGVRVGAATTLAYLGGELLGAFLGAGLAWAAYRAHLDLDAPAHDKLAVFATGPGLRSRTQNTVTEALATFLLVFVLRQMGATPSSLGPLATALLVLGIGLAMGGPTAWSINPARDLGARFAHTVLPVRGKGGSDWAYGWCAPVVGPLLGATAAALCVRLAAAV